MDIRCRNKVKETANEYEAKRPHAPNVEKWLKSTRILNLLLDDESYFTKANINIAGNDRFYSNDADQTPEKHLQKPNTTTKCLCT